MYPDLFGKKKINHWVRDRVREVEREKREVESFIRKRPYSSRDRTHSSWHLVLVALGQGLVCAPIGYGKAGIWQEQARSAG